MELRTPLAASGPMTWADRDGQPAKAGRSASGAHKLLVDGSGVVMFSWSAAGVRPAEGVWQFRLRFPAAVETRLVIDAPAEYLPGGDVVFWSEGVVGNGLRRWAISIRRKDGV